LSLGDTGATFMSDGSAGRAYGDGSCLGSGLAAALDGGGRVGSAREWKAGSARCGTLICAEGREW
jgi:hypothetical protein